MAVTTAESARVSVPKTISEFNIEAKYGRLNVCACVYAHTHTCMDRDMYACAHVSRCT